MQLRSPQNSRDWVATKMEIIKPRHAITNTARRFCVESAKYAHMGPNSRPVIGSTPKTIPISEPDTLMDFKYRAKKLPIIPTAAYTRANSNPNRACTVKLVLRQHYSLWCCCHLHRVLEILEKEARQQFRRDTQKKARLRSHKPLG